jgi:hypothetical protein
METGQTIGRFEILELAGAGGAGTVYCALDPTTSARVAVKVLHGLGEADVARFTREARLLARVRHPGVVRYVDHGHADGGSAYLVMEWLEGEDLRARLARGGLSLGESIALGRRVAEALAAVHAHGLVHRDVKPGNIFLPGGRVAEAKIIDFGLARGALSTVAMTQTGLILGTPSYMAPEQARGQRDLDARADLFSLGALLFKCVTGRAPFEGRTILAVLTKVLLDEAPRLREARPDVPPALDALVARLLAKDPDQRPAGAAEVAAALAALAPPGDAPGPGDEADGEDPAPPSELSGLTAGELRLTAMLLVGAADEDAPADAEARLASIAREHGATYDRLLEGTRVVTLVGSGVPTDQAARAARCALALGAALPGTPLALATGRSEITRRLPVGEAIDRAALMLARRRSALGAPASVIAVDEVTAALLGPRFEVASDQDGLTLRGLRAADTAARTLLGQTTPLVGRAWEIGSIEALFRDCVEEPGARAVLVVGPAGMGKSRLAHELTRALTGRHPDLEVWTAYGDPLRAGSALGLLGQVVHRACGVVDDEAPAARRRRLVEGVARRVPAAEAGRVADFLGEIAGAPAPGEVGAALRAARQDARIMSQEVGAAWEALVDGAAAAAPLLILLEDLQWADAATVRLVGAALTGLPRRPILVVALARPEVHDVFPRLWEGAPLQEVRLQPLGRRASEELVRSVLGGLASPALAARLATQAEGNAFYLEELIRAVAEGSTAGELPLPQTVLAMVQARLTGLDADTRRVLRAASVFGDAFWPGGVSALLSGSLPRAGGVDALVAQELAVVRPSSRFPGERELTFRHALLREGAYATLTEPDRELGHRLAGQWLAAQGEGDSMMLARHFELAREGARASELYLAGAWSALRGGEPALAVNRAERARAVGLPDGGRVAYLSVLGMAHAWNDAWPQAADAGDELAHLAAPGSAPWMEALALRQMAASVLGRPTTLLETLGAVMSAEPGPGAVTSLAQALAIGVLVLGLAGRFPLAAFAVARLDAVIVPRCADEPVARGWVALARAIQAAWMVGDPWAARGHAQAARKAFAEAHDTHHSQLAQAFVGMASWNLGLHAAAEDDLRALVVHGGDHLLAAVATIFLAAVLADRGKLDEVIALTTQRIEASRARVSERAAMREAEGRWLLGDALLRRGDLEAAEREIEASLPVLRATPLRWQLAAARLSVARRARGRVREALALASEARDMLTAQGGPGMRSTMIRLAHAEALDAAGDRSAADAALREAQVEVQARAARIPDLAVRAAFLAHVPENARVFSLSRAWLDDEEPTLP